MAVEFAPNDLVRTLNDSEPSFLPRVLKMSGYSQEQIEKLQALRGEPAFQNMAIAQALTYVIPKDRIED